MLIRYSQGRTGSSLPQAVKPGFSGYNGIGLLAVCAFAGGTPLDTLLKGVEARYNRAKTLQVLFTEEYTPPGHSRRTESGTLLLRKPGRMRWNYSQPAGKLFLSDGKMLWLYTPAENRVEKMKFQET